MANVKVYREADGRTHVYINGHELRKLRSIDFSEAIDAEPCFSFETYDDPDIFVEDAYVELSIEATSLQAACYLVRQAYIKDEEFRNAFIAGIKDVLIHGDSDWGIDTLAEKIGERVIG